MLEQQTCFLVTGLQIEIISKNQVNVIRIEFSRNIAPEDNQAFKFARGMDEMINAQQPCCDGLPMGGAAAESRDDFVHCRLMHTCG